MFVNVVPVIVRQDLKDKLANAPNKHNLFDSGNTLSALILLSSIQRFNCYFLLF